MASNPQENECSKSTVKQDGEESSPIECEKDVLTQSLIKVLNDGSDKKEHGKDSDNNEQEKKEPVHEEENKEPIHEEEKKEPVQKSEFNFDQSSPKMLQSNIIVRGTTGLQNNEYSKLEEHETNTEPCDKDIDPHVTPLQNLQNGCPETKEHGKESDNDEEENRKTVREEEKKKPVQKSELSLEQSSSQMLQSNIVLRESISQQKNEQSLQNSCPGTNDDENNVSYEDVQSTEQVQSLDPSMLQKPPSHITVEEMTSPQKNEGEIFAVISDQGLHNKNASYVEEEKKPIQTSGLSLDPSFLQRPVSHLTVAEITSPQKNEVEIVSAISENSGTDPGIHDKNTKCSYVEKERKPIQKSGLSLDPRFLQRPVSHLTVAEMASPQKNERKTLAILSENDETDSCTVASVQCVENAIQPALQSLQKQSSCPETNVIPNSEKTKACIDCVKPIKVKSLTDINPGDHILLVRPLYDHHAIVIAVEPVEDQCTHRVKLELIHQTNSTAGVLKNSVRVGRRLAKLKDMTQTLDLKSQKTLICKYFGTIKPFPPDVIVERAREALKNEKDQFQYEILDNNCEHFATWCVTGRKLSPQSIKIRMVVNLIRQRGFSALSDELVRNEAVFKADILCEPCYKRNYKILNVEKKEIKDKNDVKEGDIILYKYYMLLHCAVVLDVRKRKDEYIKCKIAHYRFCGPLSHRTIVQESLKIRLNGSVKVFVYDETFNLYDPEEVVKRAKQRLGEQMFVFFSNDSSNYTRWCKLKLH